MSVYCASDWHGCYWVWEKVKEILEPTDTLYFLGDAADRGSNGWQIIKELLIDPRVIYLKGNHEDLLVKGMKTINLENPNHDWFKFHEYMRLWFLKGGEDTYSAILEDNTMPNHEKKDFINQLSQLPFCTVYTNKNGYHILLSHAGCDDFETAEICDEEDFLWGRMHYKFADSWYGKDNEFIIHGHTPIEYMLEEQKEYSAFTALDRTKQGVIPYYHTIAEYNGGAYWYSKGHKVCLDMGTTWTGNAVLLDLNTFEEIIIKK